MWNKGLYLENIDRIKPIILEKQGNDIYFLRKGNMNNKDKYVLITGVAGLIGSNMADYISQHHKEYGIIGIDNLFGGYLDNVNQDVILFTRDLSTDDISDIFQHYNIEYVFHFACYAAEGLSPFVRMFNWKNNAVSTANIINCCIEYNVKRLVYTSSMSVYGHGTGKGRFDETDIPCPVDPYGISKYACEMDIQVAGEQHGLDWCIIRPHNVYGKKQNIWDKYRNVLGIWMYQILHNQPMLIYGDGEQTRAFTCVDDILEPLWNAATKKEASMEIINLGNKKGYTINEAAKILSDISGYDKIEHKEARFEVKNAVPTFEKSVNILGFEDKTPLEKGLRLMLEWAKSQPDRERFKWENYEINKGLYSYWK